MYSVFITALFSVRRCCYIHVCVLEACASDDTLEMRRTCKVKKMEKPARILIIDDDENIRKVLQTILEDEGYRVETAETAKKGIEKSEKSFYNLALIDIRLPDMEGIELLTKLRETKPKMRKIIVTGYPTLQNAVSAVNKGADGFVLKPFDVEKMLATIKEQLQKQAEEKDYSEEKIAEFIETRVKALDAEDIESMTP
jgi:DNA-binding NtrC family response regulator